MKAIPVTQDSLPPRVILEHEQRQITFSISTFQRSNFQKPEYCVFQQINQFWASLPMADQEAIYNIYNDIYIAFDTFMPKQELDDLINEKIIELEKYQGLERLDNWINYKSDINRVPSSVEHEYKTNNDTNNTRHKTYVRSEYKDLVCMCLCFRTLIPIFGEHIAQTRMSSKTTWKEYDSFRLLKNTQLIKCPAMIKLDLYINEIAAVDKNNMATIVKGISSSVYCDRLKAIVCIKRLTVADISSTNNESHLINHLYSSVIQQTRQPENDAENIVKAKNNPTADGASGNEQTSNMERYKTAFTVSTGELVEIEYWMTDLRRVLSNVTSNVTDDILNTFIEATKKFENERIYDAQVTLTQWVLRNAISPQGVGYLSHHLMIGAIAATGAALWANGHKYLAALVTSRAIINENGIVVSPVDSKKRPDQGLINELIRYYPFTKPYNGKKALDTKNYRIIECIDATINDFSSLAWRSSLPDDMLIEVFGTSQRIIPVKPDISTDLTKLCIEIGSRAWT